MLSFNEWLDMGMEQGWVSEPFCDIHDGGPMTQEEMDDFEEGHDPCIVHMRVYYGV